MRILISGGGTGGHIYPALAVARELRDRYGAELLFIGDANGLETSIVPAAGVPFAAISAGKLRRYLSPRMLTDLGRIPVGMAQALGHARRFRPDAAFTSGGYVSVPAGVACTSILPTSSLSRGLTWSTSVMGTFSTCISGSREKMPIVSPCEFTRRPTIRWAGSGWITIS